MFRIGALLSASLIFAFTLLMSSKYAHAKADIDQPVPAPTPTSSLQSMAGSYWANIGTCHLRITYTYEGNGALIANSYCMGELANYNFQTHVLKCDEATSTCRPDMSYPQNACPQTVVTLLPSGNLLVNNACSKTIHQQTRAR